jgi:hypothetical protein
MKFNNLSHEEKLSVQRDLINCIDLIGGKNYFFGMIENIRESKQHPLLNKTGKFHFENGTIVWNKEIYKDKVVALKNMLIKNIDDNILSTSDLKMKKNLNNVIKTLGKLEFTININDIKVFSFSPFNTITHDNVELNHFFQIIFFDSLNNTKRILIYSN